MKRYLAVSLALFLSLAALAVAGLEVVAPPEASARRHPTRARPVRLAGGRILG